MKSIKQSVHPEKYDQRPSHCLPIIKLYSDREIKVSDHEMQGQSMPENTSTKHLQEGNCLKSTATVQELQCMPDNEHPSDMGLGKSEKGGK